MWRSKVLIATIIALACWLGYALYSQPSRIEDALRAETARALESADLAAIQPEIDGREVQLRGSVASDDLRTEAGRLVAGIAGVRSVENLVTVAAPATPEIIPTFLEITARPDGVTLRGTVASDARRRQLVERAETLWGADGVDDRLAVDQTVETGPGPVSAVDILGVLADLAQKVRVQVEADHIRLSGGVASEEERQRLVQRIQDAAQRVPSVFSELKVMEE